VGHTSRSAGDRLFDYMNYFIFTLILLFVLYPLYFIVISSISDPVYVNLGKVWFIPKNITLDGYAQIFKDKRIVAGYINSFIYMSLGTTINVVLTVLAGYALSRKDLIGRNGIMFYIVFTMLFSGGLIPTFMLVKELGMLNTIWAMVIPNAVSVFNIIITRTFFTSTIPDELLEAAVVDGCTNTKFFTKIIVPLSMPIIAVMTLFYAVGHWNSFFQALIYLRDESLFPLQLILREILVLNQVSDMATHDEGMAVMQQKAELIKYGVVIVASVPMLVLYPFLQKYFVKGVMIGSIKG